MAGETQFNAEQLYVEFLNEKKYHQRIALFDKHFGLIPFDFPFFDDALSWFHTGSKTLELIEFFNKENDPTINLYERIFVINNHVINFNIKPVNRTQRSLLNRCIVSCFIKDKDALHNLIEKELEGVADPIEYLNARIYRINKTFAWIKEKLNEPVNMSLKIKFLAVFYKGSTSFYEDERTLNIKRRFIELYLYSQGLLFSNYQNALLEKLHEIKTNHVSGNVHFPSLKLLLLDKLGIIKHLKLTCVLQDENDTHKKIAKLLCFIMNEHADSYTAILAYLQSNNCNDTHSSWLDQDNELIKNDLLDFFVE